MPAHCVHADPQGQADNRLGLDTGPDIRMGMTWTQAQADERFSHDLAKFAADVTAALAGPPTAQPQFDAMVSLAYNIGIGAFRDSMLLKLHRERNYARAADQFSRWDKQAGKPLAGLTRWRAAEAEMYRAPA